MSRRRCGGLRVPWGVAGCLAVVAVLAAGCTSSSADGPTGSSGSAASAAVSPSVADVSTNPISPNASSATTTASAEPDALPTTQDSLDPAAQEISDRAAIERAWAHFWKVTDNLPTVPEAERRDAASSVAIEPTLTQVLGQAKSLADSGLVVYGTSIFHPYWEQSIDGKATALMGDCTDTSQSGSMFIATGEKRTVGVPDNNTRVTFVKGSDGVWRVKEIFFLVDAKC